MTLKESIQNELDSLSEIELEELYQLILDFIQTKRQQEKSSLMSGLKRITIEGPVDFAENHTQYASENRDDTADLH